MDVDIQKDAMLFSDTSEGIINNNSKRLFNLIRYSNSEEVLKFINILEKSAYLESILSSEIRLHDHNSILLVNVSEDVSINNSESQRYTLYRVYMKYTPLALAIRLYKHGVAAKLLELDNSVSASDNIALRWAIKNNNIILTQTIMSHKTFLVPHKPEGMILTAAENGEVDIIKLLRHEFSTSFNDVLIRDCIKEASQRNHHAAIAYLKSLVSISNE